MGIVKTKMLEDAVVMMDRAMTMTSFNPNKDPVYSIPLSELVNLWRVRYGDTWVDVIDRVRDAVKKLMDAIGNSAIGKAIGGIIDKVTGGKAVGGMVSAGQAVRVGELGSEVFVPTSGGQIIPNNKLGGGGNTFIFNGVIDGESARRSIEQLLQMTTKVGLGGRKLLLI